MKTEMRALTVMLALAMATLSAAAWGYLPCDSPIVSYGPFDYRTGRKELEKVERVHFTEDVEMLRRGNTSSTPAGDLNYVLLASPNHYRALMAMANLSIREKKERPTDASFTVPCYFERAIRFAPDDGNVRMVYGTYLFKIGRKEEALKELETAESMSVDSANFHYNIGLIYFDLKNYDKALSHAQRAYQLGYQLPGLKKKLQEAGKWQEPSP